MTALALHPAVVRSKLGPGLGPGRVLRRPKLAPPPEFREGAASVALVCAPAGYGKSTLMSCWHEILGQEGQACAWLSLDPDDDDSARLMHHLVAAYQSVDPVLGRGAQGELAAGLSGSAKPALESLAADLDGIDRRTVLFLDDLHFLSAPEALDIVSWLLNYAPRRCQFVVGCREQPRVPLSGLRVRRRLVEFGHRDLQFSTEETARFCESRLGQPLPVAALDRLVRKTEGWPAALELATLVLRSEADRAAVIEGFTGKDRGLMDYLGEVVFSNLDPRFRSFVLRVAQFDRVSPGLAAAVTGEADAPGLLARACSANLLLQPLGRSGEMYRFHALAAEYLRERFRFEGGDPAATLLRGAQWLHRNGDIEDAINTAVRAEAWETATRWVAEAVKPLVYLRGQHHTILRWMQRLPEEWVDRFPTIRIHYAHALAFSPQQREVEIQIHRLERIRGAMLQDPGADRMVAREIECAVQMQKALALALFDEGAQARVAAASWLDRWPEAPLHWRGTVSNVLILGLKTSSEIDAGLQWAGRTRSLSLQAESWYSAAWTEYLTALLYLKRGAYFEARQAAQAGLDVLDRHLEGHPSQAAYFHAVLATVAYEFDELERCAGHVERCMPRVAEYGQADAVLMAFLTQAKLERSLRGEAAGLDKLREGQELGARRGFSRVTISLAAAECSWHGGAGRYDEARRIAVRHGFDRLPEAGGGADLHAEKSFLVASRYLLRHAAARVVALIDEPIRRCHGLGLYRRQVELLLIKAMALRHDGRPDAAAQCLEEALRISAPRNYYRTILDEAPDLLSLFDRIDADALRDSEAAPLLRRLLRAVRNGPVSESAANTGMTEDLSKRELAIIRRLESDLSNREIAEALFISEGTLKWHLHNIYGKLGVKNRSGAVSRGRSMNLM